MGIADFSKHQNLVSSTFRGLKGRLSERVGTTEVDVQVIAGSQSGAARRLQLAQMVIGSGETSDLTLIGADVARSHATLNFERSMFGMLVDVVSEGPGLTINGVPVEAGTSAQAQRLPLEVAIGGNVVRISRPGFVAAQNVGPKQLTAAKSSLKRFDPVLLNVGVILFFLIAAAIASTILQSGQRDYAVRINDVNPIATVTPVANRDWTGELLAEAGAVDLRNELTIETLPDGLISASGNVPSGKIEQLRALQAWYDGQVNAPAIIWNIQRQTGLENMPEVLMVKTSDPKHVLLASGTTAQVGDRLVEDWSIAEIGADEMTLSRGSERIIVSYKELSK